MSDNPQVPSDETLPPYLPPRRPKSLPNLSTKRFSWRLSSIAATDDHNRAAVATRSTSRPRRKLTKRRQQQALAAPPTGRTSPEETTSRPTSYQSFSSGDTAALDEAGLSRHGSDSPKHASQALESNSPSRRPSSRLAPIKDGVPLTTQDAAPTAVRPSLRPSVLRNSSLRVETRLSDEDLAVPEPPIPALLSSDSEPQPRTTTTRPYSHPPLKARTLLEHQSPRPLLSPADLDQWPLPALPSSGQSTPSQKGPLVKPRASFKRLSSLDNLLLYREEKADWKRASSVLQQASSPPSIDEEAATKSTVNNTPNRSARPSVDAKAEPEGNVDSHKTLEDGGASAPASVPPSEPDIPERPVFRHPSTEYGFIITVSLMQLLAEYLITGFAIELPTLLSHHNTNNSTMGLFWPAALLTLILSATLLIFARLSDMYGGYPCFMFGVLWLAVWTLVPGFAATSVMVLNVSRAMQGLAIAAYMPSTFAMIGSLFPEGPRRNVVLGFYSGCAPVGFFAGFLVAGALPEEKTNWYFWTASIAAFAMAAVAYVSIPLDKLDRSELQLHMDWIGGFLITAGLILLAYALSVEPYITPTSSNRSGFSFPTCYGPFVAGMICLLIAFWYEGWAAKCPLLPFDFFTPRSVRALSLACLCFYASYGVWLYNSAEFFQSPTGVSKSASGEAISGIHLALWYAPMAIGGILLCFFSGALLHIIPIMCLLLLSALAWVTAPLLLALAPLPLDYWSFVCPSMICATIGLDLTYTVSIIFLSSAQPLKYQGLSGAVASSLVNLGMSFALPISEIAMKKAQESVEVPAGNEMALNMSLNWGFRATFFYAAASAGLGLIICVLCVRISRGVVSRRPVDEERPRAGFSESTLVGDGDGRVAAGESEVRYKRRRESV